MKLNKKTALIINKAFYYLKSLPIQVIIILFISTFFSSQLNYTCVSFFYTISKTLVDLLFFLMQLIIFSYIFSSVISLEKNSPLIILSILLFITLSNLTALTTSYCLGSYCLPKINIIKESIVLPTIKNPVQPIFEFHLPEILSPGKTMLLAFTLGFFVVFFLKGKVHENIKINSLKLKDFSSYFLKKIFTPLLPFYMLGFILKMSFENHLTYLVKIYGYVFLLTCLLLATYICCIYLLASQFSFHKFFKIFKSMLPAGLTGFTTMSGTIAIPLAISATEMNTKNKKFTQLIIPSITNIHMLGDNLSIVLTAITLMLINNFNLPNFSIFLPFAMAFCAAKFSCVGIAGASVLVVLPVLKEHLGFTQDMINTMTIIYILQDSLGTFTNVMCNGAFAIIVERFLKKIKIIK